MLRLRIGILLIILSWFPFAQIFIEVAHNNQKLTSDQATNEFRLIVWGLQILIGFVGLWLAGKTAISEARKSGWKQAPKNLWMLFWHAEN